MLDRETLELVRTAVESSLHKKGFEIVVLDVAELSSFADSFVLCSAANVRQLRAIAEEIEAALAKGGHRHLHVEGLRSSEWVLLDYGHVIVHLMTEEKHGARCDDCGEFRAC